MPRGVARSTGQTTSTLDWAEGNAVFFQQNAKIANTFHSSGLLFQGSGVPQCLGVAPVKYAVSGWYLVYCIVWNSESTQPVRHHFYLRYCQSDQNGHDDDLDQLNLTQLYLQSESSPVCSWNNILVPKGFPNKKWFLGALAAEYPKILSGWNFRRRGILHVTQLDSGWEVP